MANLNIKHKPIRVRGAHLFSKQSPISIRVITVTKQAPFAKIFRG